MIDLLAYSPIFKPQCSSNVRTHAQRYHQLEYHRNRRVLLMLRAS